jgi:membrane-associated protein
MIPTITEWIFHLDTHLSALAANHGAWVYALLFLVIFIETGLVVMPFLPGDSLLFVSGALAAAGELHAGILFASLSIAAVTGDSVNYAIGALVRRKAIDTERIPLLKPDHLKRTHAFFDRHGSKTIILARFVPIVRTLAPFVAAIGNMHYPVFLRYNIMGGLLWIGSLTACGFLLGNVPWMKTHLSFALLGIVVLSLLPGLIGWLRTRRR